MKFSMRMITLDMALEYTGYAVYNVDSKGNFGHQLADVGLINTDVGWPVDMRVRNILGEVSRLWHKHSTNCTIIEKPATAIYGGPMQSKQYIMGRATSIAKVNSAAFAVLGMCYGNGMYHRMVEPSQWQPNFKEAGQSKSWSIKQANGIIAYLKFNHRKLLGKSKEDHNIADAINIGSATILNYHSKKWEVPNLPESE